MTQSAVNDSGFRRIRRQTNDGGVLTAAAGVAIGTVDISAA
jgi:hypothetical protein